MIFRPRQLCPPRCRRRRLARIRLGRSLPAQQRGRRIGRHRLAEIVALGHLTAGGSQKCPLLGSLHAFRYDFNAERPGEPDDHSDDRRVVGIGRHAADETPIDFQARHAKRTARREDLWRP